MSNFKGNNAVSKLSRNKKADKQSLAVSAKK